MTSHFDDLNSNNPFEFIYPGYYLKIEGWTFEDLSVCRDSVSVSDRFNLELQRLRENATREVLQIVDVNIQGRYFVVRCNGGHLKIHIDEELKVSFTQTVKFLNSWI